MENLIVKPKRMNHRLVRLKIENAVIQTISDATMANVYQSDGAVIMIMVRVLRGNFINFSVSKIFVFYFRLFR